MKTKLTRSLVINSLIGSIVASTFVLAVAIGTADAQQQPSAKVTAKTANLTLLPETNVTSEWRQLNGMVNTIKTANQKDLFISASFEVGLFTQTIVSSKGMQKDQSIASAEVQVQVLLDGNPVEPGPVVYGRRMQTLSATLEGAIGACLSLVLNPDGSTSIVVDPLCVTPETIELILETLDAASFNFVAVDVPQGVHTIAVQARVKIGGSAQNGSFLAKALVGKGSMTVESVRLIKNEDVAVPVPVP